MTPSGDSRRFPLQRHLPPAFAAVGIVAAVALVHAAARPRAHRDLGDAVVETLQWTNDSPLSLTFPEERPVESAVLSAEAAIETDEGWVVLDARGHQLVYLSADGDFLRLAGRRGTGPGELNRPVALARAGERLVVLEGDGRLVLFDRQGTPDGDARLARGAGCGSSTVVAILSGSDSLPFLTTCTRSNGRISARVELITPAGARRLVADVEYLNLRSRAVEPFRMPKLASVEGRVGLGLLPERCLRLLGRGGDTGPRLCYPELPLQALPDSVRNDLEESARQLAQRGLVLTVPDYLPPFRDLLTGDGVWGFLALPESGGEAIDVVEGRRLRRLLAPPHTRLFLARGRVLMAREALEGTAFAVLPIP